MSEIHSITVPKAVADTLTPNYLSNLAHSLYKSDARKNGDHFYSFSASPGFDSSVELEQKLRIVGSRDVEDKYPKYIVRIKLIRGDDGVLRFDIVREDPNPREPLHKSVQAVVDGIIERIKAEKAKYAAQYEAQTNKSYAAIGALEAKGLPTNIIRHVVMPMATTPMEKPPKNTFKELMNRIAKGGSRRRTRRRNRKTARRLKK